MEHAKRQAVGDDVGTASRMPLYVRSFQPQQSVFDSDVEAANGATALVGTQHIVAEPRVTFLSHQVLFGLWSSVQVLRNSNRVANVRVHGPREVTVQYFLGSLDYEHRVGP